MTDKVVLGKTTYRLAEYVDENGALFDPDNPVVSVTDPAGVVRVTDATPVRNSLGMYEYDYLVALNDLTGTWVVYWSGSKDGEPVPPTPDYFDVVTPGEVSVTGYTYDPTTDIGQVRLYIDDRDMSNNGSSVPLEQRSSIFSDQEIGTFLADAQGVVLFAAAKALITIAGNRQLLVQSRRIGKATVDFGSARQSLMAQAQALVQMAISQPADGIADIAYDDFTLRRIIVNTQLRMGT
jgi:hypothetical protein